MNAALIVAAGKGIRMGMDCPKPYLTLGDRPILSHCLTAFAEHPLIDQVCLVVNREEKGRCRDELLPALALNTPVILVEGGVERQASVYNGLRAIPHSHGIVLIHDGARPFVAPDLISACIEGARQWKACIPALPATETLKRVNAQHCVEETLERRHIWMAQTPQAFELSLIKRSHEEALRRGWQVTDDAGLLERMGVEVHVIEGRRENIKITVPQDLVLAEKWLGLHSSGRLMR